MSDIDYRLVPTAVGRAEFANAAILKRGVDLTHMAVGDGGGVIEPVHGDMTALVNEVYRAEINAISAGDTPGHIIVELVIPADVGGWVIREAGVFTADGAMVGVANYPPTTKPLLTSGGGVEEHIRAHLLLTEAEAGTIQLTVDPTMVLSTHQHVADKIDEHNADPDAHADLRTGLDNKADKGHGHEMDDVSGLVDALGNKAPDNHDHLTAEVTDLLSAPHQWAKSQRYAQTQLAIDNGSVTWNCEANPSATLLLTADVTSMTVTNAQPGAAYDLTIVQDATGGWTCATPASWCWPGGMAYEASTDPHVGDRIYLAPITNPSNGQTAVLASVESDYQAAS